MKRDDYYGEDALHHLEQADGTADGAIRDEELAHAQVLATLEVAEQLKGIREAISHFSFTGTVEKRSR